MRKDACRKLFEDNHLARGEDALNETRENATIRIKPENDIVAVEQRPRWSDRISRAIVSVD